MLETLDTFGTFQNWAIKTETSSKIMRLKLKRLQMDGNEGGMNLIYACNM